MDKTSLKQNNSLNMVTFFKGVAIILVILVHSHQKFLLPDNVRIIPRFGQMGCQLFFLLSAFGLCYSLSAKPITWFKFMKKRLSKLYLGFYFAILAHLILRIVNDYNTGNISFSSININGIITNMLFLNGLVPIEEINNLTVRGGWFVGTIVILYALFPLLYKVYNIDNKFWQKIKLIVFPLIAFIFSVSLIVGLENINPIFRCTNNSFMYFSFINQLTPFVLGICLYDIIERISLNKIKLSIVFSLLFLILTIKLFYERYDFSFFIVPTTMALSMMFLYIFATKNIYINNAIAKGKNIVVKCILAFGKISFQIYLLHTFIVYNLVETLLPYLRHIKNSDEFWYCVLLPILYVLCYLTGFIFNKFLKLFSKKQKSSL